MYAHDANGNITRIVWGDSQKDNGYEYDSLNQMVREEIIRNGVTRIIEYSYDDLGNMDTRTEGGTEYTYSYTYDASVLPFTHSGLLDIFVLEFTAD